MREKSKKTIEKRIGKNKELLIEHLKKTPIAQIACDKAGVGRATYYRWRTEDSAFSVAADAAILEGALLINDMAESQLISAIRDRNFNAISFWLKHHHKNYTTKVELTGKITHAQEELTAEEVILIEQALRLALPSEESNKKNDTPKHEEHDAR